MERLDVILSLARDLGVNLGGVEIILRMCKKMDAVQRQMREFVKCVNHSMVWVGGDEDSFIAATRLCSVRPRERESEQRA